MTAWQNYLNFYNSLPDKCEQSWGIISEPVDTISNIAFFISAYFIYKLFKDNKIKDSKLWWLFTLVILIGAGSTLYHGFRSPINLIADQVPIYIFVLYSVYLLVSKVTKSTFLRFGIPLILVLLQLIFLSGVPIFISNIPTRHVLNVLFVACLSFWIYQKLGKVTLNIIPILLLYSLGIASRYFDLIVCPINSFGTHFFWHFCVAVVTYLTARFFVKLH